MQTSINLSKKEKILNPMKTRIFKKKNTETNNEDNRTVKYRSL